MMDEMMLQFIWKHGLFIAQNLRSTHGEKIEILDQGKHNLNAGPDFTNAKIRIGNLIWVGNVEIHIRSSDWFKHKHHLDQTYENVVLHVVYQHDKEVAISDSRNVPVLSLAKMIPKRLIKKYESLIVHSDYPCDNNIDDLSKLHWLNFQERLVCNRLERKVEEFKRVFSNTQSLEKTLLVLLSKSFGIKINQLPMMWMMTRTPLKLIQKKRKSLYDLEAWLFGLSGLLYSTRDQYMESLLKRFEVLNQTHQIAPLQSTNWKFFRVRKFSYPTLRIAQFAATIHQVENEMQLDGSNWDFQRIRNKLKSVQVSEYWRHRYSFQGGQVEYETRLTDDFIDKLITNFYLPAKIFIDQVLGCQSDFDIAAVLETLRFESNKITSRFVSNGMDGKNAWDSIAYLELNHTYCSQKKCLNCVIGQSVIKSGFNHDSKVEKFS